MVCVCVCVCVCKKIRDEFICEITITKIVNKNTVDPQCYVFHIHVKEVSTMYVVWKKTVRSELQFRRGRFPLMLLEEQVQEKKKICDRLQNADNERRIERRQYSFVLR